MTGFPPGGRGSLITMAMGRTAWSSCNFLNLGFKDFVAKQYCLGRGNGTTLPAMRNDITFANMKHKIMFVRHK